MNGGGGKMSHLISMTVANANTEGGNDNSYKKLTAGGTNDLLMVEEGNGHSAIQMTTLGNRQPAWVSDVNTVEECLKTITREMNQLQSMHAQRVGSVFGKDLADREGQIEKRTRDITDQFRVAERCLQKVGMATRKSGGEEATVGANIQRR